MWDSRHNQSGGNGLYCLESMDIAGRGGWSQSFSYRYLTYITLLGVRFPVEKE